MLSTNLQIIGYVLLPLSVMHIVFPKYFNWKKELATLSMINREMMQVHTFFIALTLFGMGLLCITSANDLLSTSLGKKILLGLAIFWTIRLYMQFFTYSSQLWKGKTFETIVHIIFSIGWIYISIVCWLSYFAN